MASNFVLIHPAIDVGMSSSAAGYADLSIISAVAIQNSFCSNSIQSQRSQSFARLAKVQIQRVQHLIGARVLVLCLAGVSVSGLRPRKYS
jgi:hypothetical protein